MSAATSRGQGRRVIIAHEVTRLYLGRDMPFGAL